jgi:hypothetical protein
VVVEGHHWIAVLDSTKKEHSLLLSDCRDNYKRVLMEKDIEIANLTASKDKVIDQLKKAFAISKDIIEGSRRRHRMSPIFSLARSERFEEDHG